MVKKQSIPEKIGEGLVKLGEMTQEQVAEVLRIQKEGNTALFGEIAILLGYVDMLSIIKYMESTESK